ncbi:MAG: cobalamin B12-binding domain-containing protein [Candidatus Dormibacteraeota bacterium]|nr:cobalamin B12-binding domain-containing protein [Candidatus Dormibacteraeota bacterium]MBO0744344.1 cobalamin B12-binding domain-containing protein [Candidatus Dormibacteraeota bacterium]
MDRGRPPVRVLVAKVGLDGHDRGAKIVARALRDAGMEVVYTGLHRKPEEIVLAALQEDVDVIGISILSGAHLTLVPKVIDGMQRHGLWGDIALIVGGVIPEEDAERLREMGVAEVMDQDTTPDQLVRAVRELAEARPA